MHCEPPKVAARAEVRCAASCTRVARSGPRLVAAQEAEVNGRICRILGTLATVPVVLVTFAVAAQAAVTVSRAELSGGRLRVEGQAAPSRPITIDGAQMTTSSSTGSFKVDRSGFTGPADCTVDVSDGVATAADVRLSGCVVTSPPPPPPPPPATTVTLDSVSLSPATLQGG